jgi:hypothetical protein
MKNQPKAQPLLLLSLLALAATTARAANRVVQVGDAIQDSVAASASGDVVIVRGGTFPEQAITISQPIRMAREKGTAVTIGGTITLRDVNGSIVLRDFAINVNGNGKLVIENCSNVGLEDLTELPQGIVIKNSKVVLRSCQLGALTISDGSEVEVIDSTSAALSVTGSTLQIVDSVCQAFTSSNSSVKVIKTTHTTGGFTGGSALLQGSTANADVTITNCDWRAHGATFKGNLTANNSHSKLLRTTVEKAFTHLGTDKDCVVFQSTVGRVSGDVLSSDANRTWVAYSTIHHASQLGGTEAHFIGNQILTDKAKANSGIVGGGLSCVLTVANNHFYHGGDDGVTSANISGAQVDTRLTGWVLKKSANLNHFVTSIQNQLHAGHSNGDVKSVCRVLFSYMEGTSEYSLEHEQTVAAWSGTKVYANPRPSSLVAKVEVYLRTTAVDWPAYEISTAINSANSYPGSLIIGNVKRARINNNFFRDTNRQGHCIHIPTAPAEGAEIKGNAFWRDSGSWRKHAVNAPSGGEVIHNYFHSTNADHTVTGGIANFDNVMGGDPKFDTSDWSLNAGSVLLNAGPAEPEYNDHDGSRNDVGLLGGHAYDPAGKTSVNPVVLSGDQSIFRLNLGESTPLVIKARAAVATPDE